MAVGGNLSRKASLRPVSLAPTTGASDRPAPEEECRTSALPIGTRAPMGRRRAPALRAGGVGNGVELGGAVVAGTNVSCPGDGAPGAFGMGGQHLMGVKHVCVPVSELLVVEVQAAPEDVAGGEFFPGVVCHAAQL